MKCLVVLVWTKDRPRTTKRVDGWIDHGMDIWGHLSAIPASMITEASEVYLRRSVQRLFACSVILSFHTQRTHNKEP